MRSCPTCQRTYQDDNQSNCAYDGAQLSPPYYPQPVQYQQQSYGPPPGVNPMTPPGYPPQGGWQGYPTPPAYQADMGQYVPCPRCRRPDPQKVNFTWWGGMLGPRMLTHVKCNGCGLAYNGKTGESNDTKIKIYLIVGTAISLLIGILLVFVVSSR